jgi:hypothetical protein
MKKYISLITVFLFQISSLTLNAQSVEKDIQLFYKSVAFVYTEKNSTEIVNNKELEIWYKDAKTNQSFPKKTAISGTSFFVSKDLDLYLVTAEHVAKSADQNTTLWISNSEGKTRKILLKDITVDNQINWTSHPISDVSVVRLDASKIDSTLSIVPIPFQLIVDTLEAPMRIMEVTVYGFPLRLGVNNRISPITKTLKPASGIIDITRSDNNKLAPFFLLDDPSVSGFSGGPVFELPQSFPDDKKFIVFIRVHRLVGLVHGTISKDFGGFTAIVPGNQIKETLELAPGHTGIVKILYDNDKLWTEREYKNGTPWNVMSNYDINGNLQDKGTLINGTGTLKIYDEKSKLIETLHYKNGSLMKVE